LVTVGGIRGILTAAHVLKALPDEGRVAIILSAESPAQFRRMKIDMKNAHKLVVCASEFTIDGPDLGFLRISSEDAGSIAAISSLYNLTKRADDVLAKQKPAPNSSDALAGVIHERTKVLETERGRATSFDLLFCGGQSGAERSVGDHDTFTFAPANEQDFELPSSFAGASGGGIWRFFFVMKDAAPSIVERTLIGVPFWQSRVEQGKRIIACHGTKSIYGTLAALVKKKWPQ